jgi:hypothetical protein
MRTLVSQRITRSAAVSGLVPPPPSRAPRRNDKGEEKAKEKGIAVVPGSSPSKLPPPPRASRRVSPTRNKGKGKETETGTGRDRKRKRTDNDDEAYQDRHDLTAEELVQQVMCPSYAHRNRADVSNSRRHGYKPYESTRPSLSFTLAIMSSYACAIGPLGHSTSQTSLSLPRA